MGNRLRVEAPGAPPGPHFSDGLPVTMLKAGGAVLLDVN